MPHPDITIPPVPADLAAPRGHYSHAVRAAGLVFVAGELPVTADGRLLNEASFEEQTRQVLANVAAALRAAGSSVDKLVQVRVYVTDVDLWPTFNAVYAQWCGEARPARIVVPVPKLHYGFQVEVEATALA
jgi:reactive intermediate/imine deaminase